MRRFVGERVIVIASWSTFRGKRGRVTQTKPFVMVHLDEERLPLRFEESVLVAEASERHIGGAE